MTDSIRTVQLVNGGLKHLITWAGVYDLAERLAESIRSNSFDEKASALIYGVPRGGIYAAQAVVHALQRNPTGIYWQMTDKLEEADIVVDDLVDSGATFDRIRSEHPSSAVPFYALFDKRNGFPFPESRGNPINPTQQTIWVEFPWETSQSETGPQENIRRILQYIGEDVEREGLRETPDRVVRSYSEIFSGYNQDPASVFKTFADGACDEMVLLRNVEFYSVCEHHMQPFFGRAHIAYIPGTSVIGVSKLARLLEIYARRLQIQERLTTQVTEALDKYLQPKGSACVIEAKHFCMVCRGVHKQNSELITSSLTGVFRENLAARGEFMSLIRGN